MNLDEWTGDVKRLLARFAETDLGVPLRTNSLGPPNDREKVIMALDHLGLAGVGTLVGFYTRCDGLTFADVGNGYWIDPLERLGDLDREFRPQHVTGPCAGDVVAIGSDGGGGKFVIRRGVLDVLYLPEDAAVDCRGVFHGDEVVHGRVVAEDFAGFLKRLGADLRAMVEGDEDHEFIS